MKLIEGKDFKAFSSFFSREMGDRRAEFFMRMLSIDKVNQLYENSKNYTGAGFAGRLLKDLGINYVIGNVERLKQLPKGAFITISNHPYGGLDGIILIDIMAGIRSDYKLMVNKILYLVKTLRENFIPVTPAGNKNTGMSGTSIHGIRETLMRLQEGHPVGFFPSGAVSDFSLKDFRISDRKWQASILHLIHFSKVPVLPVRFFDTNSLFFYLLGLISWRVRLLKLPSELFNKGEHEPRIGIGKIITVREQEQFTDIGALGTYLRKCIYEMPVPSSFIPRCMLKYPEFNLD